MGMAKICADSSARKLVAEYSTNVESVETAKVAYLTSDHLGSPRVNTDRDGNRNFVEANTTFEGFNKLCANNTELCAELRKVLNPSANTSDNRLSSSDGYVFDTSGNTVRDPQSRRFTYDGENKQVKVETLDLNGNPVSTVGEYSYDGDGRRIKKHVPSTGEVTVFVYDAAGKSIAEYSTQISQDPKVSYTTSDHLVFILGILFSSLTSVASL